MPFSFQLLIEFFFPGLILLCSGILMLELSYPTDTAEIFKYLASKESPFILLAAVLASLLSYFLGTTANAVSNLVIRERMGNHRRQMIRRKLGLTSESILDELHADERQIVQRHLPRFKSKTIDDKLNEFYAAARTFCSTYSDRTARAIDYHWGLVRLSRATLLPLLILCLVFGLRLVFHHAHLANAIALGITLLLFFLTRVSYQYREKFLIYTVFDTFFEAARMKEIDKHSVK